MDKDKLEQFRGVLLEDLRRHAELVSEDQAAAIDAATDDSKETGDMAVRDVIEELALKLGERESQIVADIDQALLRIEEGSYGLCSRCGKAVPEERLEAMPTARYDATCQAIIEGQRGTGAGPSL
jgi:DnaK suppressor protein